jgi:hypothetical protein
MNCYTKMIMDYLKISASLALKVQYKMECSDIDFSESSDRALKKAAKEAYDELITESMLEQ